MPEVLLNPITGLSTSKLALATATEADVANGKTFYAGNKKIKTGSNKLAKFSRIIRLYGYSIYDGRNNYFLISIFENGEFTSKLVGPGESYDDDSFSVRLTSITSRYCDGYFTPKLNITAKYSNVVGDSSFGNLNLIDRVFEKDVEVNLWNLHRVPTFCIIEFSI